MLVLIAVVRGTHRLLRATIWALSLAAVAGAVSALTYEKPDVPYVSPWFPPEVPLDQDEQFAFGLSPLWYAAALVASALVLMVVYYAGPARRALIAALGSAVALCFVPAADQARPPVTTAEDCAPPEPTRPGAEQPPPRTGERTFVCVVRLSRALPFSDTTPDRVLIAHGHRLCGIYTRNDPRELAREELDVRTLAGALAGICPSAAAEVEAQRATQDQEFEEFEAEEQRKCDATPRHRPLIKPAKAIRLKKPEWPEANLDMYDPETPGSDPLNDGVYAKIEDDGLVGSGPGHLIVRTHSDLHVCVTLETYTRRPPVETKGWDHVVEAGFQSTIGKMVFMDGLSGTTLPDLSLNGRKGHYRVRVHFAWFPWEGGKYGTQRLLIMAYPGAGDKVVTYRKPAEQPD